MIDRPYVVYGVFDAGNVRRDQDHVPVASFWHEIDAENFIARARLKRPQPGFYGRKFRMDSRLAHARSAHVLSPEERGVSSNYRWPTA